MNRFAVVLSSVLLCGAFAVCQDSASLTTDAGLSHFKMHFAAAQRHSGPAVTGVPYSAEESEESDQTLADGTHITQQTPPVKRFRDSMGRTRTERQPFRHMTMRSEQIEMPTLVEIEDPVAHVRYVLDSDHRIAHRVELKSREERLVSPDPGTVQPASGETSAAGGLRAETVAGTATTSTPRTTARTARVAVRPKVDDGLSPKTTSESLGTQMMEGVLVEGRRTTTTWPTGSMGNDRPLTTARERWFSAALKLEVLTTSDDPRSGQHTHKISNLSTGEPDAALFQPPPGYTVKDETGEFEISWTAPQR